jgi:hypothetical protein
MAANILEGRFLLPSLKVDGGDTRFKLICPSFPWQTASSYFISRRKVLSVYIQYRILGDLKEIIFYSNDWLYDPP